MNVMTKDWIYRLTKNELIIDLQTLGVDATGTVEDLRRRLSQFVSQNLDMYRATLPEEKGVTCDQKIFPAEENSTTEITARTIDQIRKWRCHFEGKDPLAFLKRVEKLKSAYGLAGQQLLNGLPEFLWGGCLIMVPK